MHERAIRSLTGLSQSQVAQRLATYGHNTLQQAKKRGMGHIILSVVREPMFLLLIACGTLYLIIGEPQDALMLLLFVIIMMGITIVQEGKTEKTLEALRDLSSPRAMVIRDGERITIAGRDVVPDDIVVLSEGERVPADGVVLWAANLSIDESLLTGESVSVTKQAVEGYADSDCPMQRPNAESSLFVYAGSLVVGGQGVYRVRSTGSNTEMGKIGESLQSLDREDTALQRETNKIVRLFFVIAAVLCLLIIVVYGLTRGNWLEGVLSGITLAMAMLPEEFPVVLTIFLALGASRISRKHVLARRMHAVESLGSATVLCSDKTGTITQNKMQVQQLWADGERFIQDPQKKKTVPESLHPLIEYGILASRKDPFDPMEKAFLEVADQKLIDVLHVHPSWDIVREYPLSQGFFSVTNVWKNETAKTYEVAAKGAVETIMDICHLDEEARSAIFEEVSDMAGKGLRILAVAKGTYAKGEALPESQHDFDFDFLGLVALADPIRPTASEAIGLCHQAGIRVVMITGDYPQTASNIAGQIGLDNPSMVMTGMELETLEDSVLQEKLKHCNVFARVIPEQKLQLIKALKANGERVAMTGDGVNDAPALKASDIGIAMGQRGTDVAREASSLVLLDDDFSSIVWAVRIGRRIFDNLRKAMAYIVSVHIPIAGMSIIPVLFQWKELALLPVHIVFLELLIDPACSIVFECEEEEAGVMQRTPASYASSLFSRSMLFISSLQGLVSLLFVLCTWFGFKYAGFSLEAQRTGSFITLIISNLALILTNRSWTERISKSFRHANAALGWVMSAALIFLALVISIRPLQQVFHFASIPLWAIGAATLSGMLSIVWFELYKSLKGRSRN